MTSWSPQLPPYRDFKKKQFNQLAELGTFVYQIGESPLLRLPSREVPVSKIATDEMKVKYQYLKECLLRYRKITGVGRGITAVQVGILERFSAIFMPDNEIMIIVNPKISKRSKKMLRYSEMCMSASPIIAPTVRPSWIEFTYYDEDGKRHFWKTKDTSDVGRMMNRVMEHEIDHMEGIINIDRVPSRELIMESNPDYYKNARFEEV